MTKAPGYHLREIPKGVLGDASKVVEEALELEDAMEQGNRVMALCEASDLLGAVEALLGKHFPGFGIADLKIMSDATKRAFESGRRQPSA